MASAESVFEELEELQFLAFAGVAAASVVSYDYIINFSRELELIWMKPLSVLSVLFAVVRYLGLVLDIRIRIIWCFFRVQIGVVMYQFVQWLRLIYTVTADVIMILRVSVMFNQPKRARQVLLFLYSLVTINSIVFTFLWMGPNSGVSIGAQPLTFVRGVVCYEVLSRNHLGPVYDGIPRGVFDILLIVLATYRFAVHVIETRRRMGQQNTNKIWKLLFEHSLLYFVLNFAYEMLPMGLFFPTYPIVYAEIAVLYANTIPFLMYPRLVLDMKDYRATSGGVQIGSNSSGNPRTYGHSKSPSVPVTESGEYELSEGTSTRVSQQVPGQSC